jgi:hypothetical protein
LEKKINKKKREKLEKKVRKKDEKKSKNKKECTVDYYCNPQCIECG